MIEKLKDYVAENVDAVFDYTIYTLLGITLGLAFSILGVVCFC